MVALLGREDPLLDAGRFGRLLRQANYAEVADVRRVGEDGYEVSPHRSQRIAQAGVAASTPTAERAAAAPAVSAQPAAPEPAPAEPARAAATLRFRRGSRGPTRAAEVPLVGVVAIEPEPSGEPGQRKEPERRRGAGRKTASATKGPKVAAPPPPEAAAPTAAKKPRRGSRSRSRGAPKSGGKGPAQA
jgi:hypothetical protein